MEHEEELRTFEAHYPRWRTEQQGRFVVIKGSDVRAFCPTYESALETGYRAYGLDESFLTKQILATEPMALFSRDLGI